MFVECAEALARRVLLERHADDEARLRRAFRLCLGRRPDRVVIVGGGSIGVEFASILCGLGSDVRVILRRDLPLRGFDIDLRRELLTAMRQMGIKVETETTVSSIERDDGEVHVDADGPGGKRSPRKPAASWRARP